jgi:hypothetical protein
MNKKAHERLSAMKQRVDEYHMEVTNGFISYTYEDSFDGILDSCRSSTGICNCDRCYEPSPTRTRTYIFPDDYLPY